MSLSESVMKKLSKDKVIALTLEYQNKFDSILANINQEISDLRKNYELCVRTLRLQTSQHKTEGADWFVGTTVLD